MNYKLEEIIDIKLFQTLQDRLNEIYSFPSAIIDNDGNILTAVAWQDICTKFHRTNPECEKECIKSDQYILQHLHEANPAVSYKCPHGLIDNATPIIIDGVHYGNFFTGQFFLEQPDLDFFRDQAKKYRFEEESYLEAVKKVPVWTKEQLNSYLFFIKGLIEIISTSGLKNLNEERSRVELIKSQTLYHDLVETAQDLIWQCDADGRYTYLNHAWEDVFGYKISEMIGKKFTDFQAKEWARKDLNEFIRLKKGKIVKGLETVHLGKAGNEIYLIFNAKFIHDEDGNFIGTRGSAYNITERKIAEGTLKESEFRLKSIIDNAPFGAHNYKLNSEGRLIFIGANKVADNILQIDNNQFIGKTIGEAFPALLDTEIPEAYTKVAKTGENYVTEQIEYDENNITGAFEVNAVQTGNNQMAAFFRDVTEQKRAIQALGDSEEKFRLSFETSPDSININRLSDGLYVDINEGFTSITGYTKSDVIGKTSIEMNIWEKIEDRLRLGALLKKHGKVENLEARFVTKSGQITYGLMSAAVIMLNNEPHIISITRNIDEIKQTQDRLQKNETLFRTAFENSATGMYLTTPEGSILQVNKKLCDILGYSRDELLSYTYQQITHPEDIKLSDDRVAKTIERGSDIINFKKRYLKKNGKILWAEVSSSLIKDKDEDPLYFITHIIDITDRKKAEEKLIKYQKNLEELVNELKESETKYRKLVELSPDAVLIHVKGIILFVNNAALSLFEAATKDDIIGKKIIDLVHPDFKEMVKQRIGKILSENEKVATIEEKLITLKGNEFYADVSAIPITIDGSSGVQVVARDTTERRRIEDELKTHRNNLEEMVNARTSELEEKNKELERFNNLFIGREFRIKELRTKVKELEIQLGRKSDYFPGFRNE